METYIFKYLNGNATIEIEAENLTDAENELKEFVKDFKMFKFEETVKY